MRLTIAVLCLVSCCLVPITYAASTTVYLVRHTEKDLANKDDPALTKQGELRAQQWAELLQYEKISAVYSTNTRRTRDTAKPIAAAQNIEVQLYEVGDLAEADLNARHQDQSIVVVGHSNTVPGLVNALLSEGRYSELDESDYDSLFIVDVDGQSKSSKQLFIPLAAPVSE